jgi:hypothetical protein
MLVYHGSNIAVEKPEIISVYNFDYEAAEKSLKYRIFPSADDYEEAKKS